MDNISISIPNDPRAIAAAVVFFTTLRDGEIAKPATSINPVEVEKMFPAPSGIDATSIDPAGQDTGSIPEPSPEAVFATGGIVGQTMATPATVGDGNAPEYVIPVPSAAAVIPPPPPATGVELDSAGQPWDARIHSTSKARVADGTWRLRRNLDPAILATVRAELGQAMAAPAPVVPPPPAAPAPAPAPGGISFAGLLQRITAKGITKEQATAAAVKLGLPSFAIVATRPDLLPAMAAELGVA